MPHRRRTFEYKPRCLVSTFNPGNNNAPQLDLPNSCHDNPWSRDEAVHTPYNNQLTDDTYYSPSCMASVVRKQQANYDMMATKFSFVTIEATIMDHPALPTFGL